MRISREAYAAATRETATKLRIPEIHVFGSDSASAYETYIREKEELETDASLTEQERQTFLKEHDDLGEMAAAHVRETILRPFVQGHPNLLKFYKQLVSHPKAEPIFTPLLDVIKSIADDDGLVRINPDIEAIQNTILAIREQIETELKGLPFKDLCDILKVYVEHVHDTAAHVESELPTLIEQGKERIFAQLERYNLTKEEAVTRLAGIQYSVFDPMLPENAGVKGDYSPPKHLIRVDLSRSAEDLTKTIDHELFHAMVSGSAAYEETDPTSVIYRSYGPNVRLTKIGLEFVSKFTSKELISKEKRVYFEWLNEAITEHSAILLDPQKRKGSTSYTEFRKIYDLLKRSGTFPLPDQLFFHAYAEDFDPDAPKEKRLVHTRNLFREIKKAYPHHTDILKRIDDIVKNNGAGAAITFLTETFAPHYTP